jgi:glutamate-1-semialdehyde 2,1-aminomutase
VAANMNLVPPNPGFLAGLRIACDAVGALLIFDEVITGFRIESGGAAAWSGVTPDLWCFGKVIGGGLPVGAVGGSRELLASLAPEGPVYQAGTLSGNPLATAAGHAVLNEVSDDDYAEIGSRVRSFAAKFASAVSEGGLAARVPVVGPLVGLFLASQPDQQVPDPVDYVTAREWAANGVYPRFFHAMLRRGVALAPGAYEVMFPGLSHDDDVLDRVVSAAGEAAVEVAKELADGQR